MSPQRQREFAAWLVGILVGAVALMGAASAGASTLFVTRPRYERDRLADSLWRVRVDHRTYVTMCHVLPSDSECTKTPQERP